MNQIRRLDFTYQAMDPELMADVKKSWIAWEELRKEFKIKRKNAQAVHVSSGVESTLLHEIHAMEKSANIFDSEILSNPLQKLYYRFFRFLVPKIVRTRSLEFNVRCMNLARHVIFQEEYIRHLEEKLKVASQNAKGDKV
jgi:hypothetical protein